MSRGGPALTHATCTRPKRKAGARRTSQNKTYTARNRFLPLSRIHRHRYTDTGTCTYRQTDIHMYIHTYMHACMQTYIHTYIRTYTHACTHTYLFCAWELVWRREAQPQDPLPRRCFLHLYTTTGINQRALSLSSQRRRGQTDTIRISTFSQYSVSISHKLTVEGWGQRGSRLVIVVVIARGGVASDFGGVCARTGFFVRRHQRGIWGEGQPIGQIR